MKLNPHSWHARWYQWLSEKDLPDNLCNYVWGFLWENMKLLGKIVIGVTIVSFLAVTFSENWPQSLYITLAAFVTIAGLVLVGFTITWVVDRPSIGIVGAYIKAKKEKYCPRIEWDKD